MPDSTGRILSILIEVRWADTDAYGHVNNVTWLRYLEEARVRLLGLPDLLPMTGGVEPPVYARLEPGFFAMVAAQRIQYVNELGYSGQSVEVRLWISRIGSSSIDLSYEITDAEGEMVYLLAQVTMVMRDHVTRSAHRFSPADIAVLHEHLAEPNHFR